jgi:hypothetical protein
MVILRLKPWDQRAGKGENVKAVIGKLFAKTSGIRDAKVISCFPHFLKTSSESIDFTELIFENGCPDGYI